MCQGLLYALCYHLENLLHPQSDSDVNFEAAQLQHVHISSQTQAHASVHQNSWQQEGMSPAQLKQQLADLLLTILRHRYAVLPIFSCRLQCHRQICWNCCSLAGCTGCRLHTEQQVHGIGTGIACSSWCQAVGTSCASDLLSAESASVSAKCCNASQAIFVQILAYLVMDQPRSSHLPFAAGNTQSW